MSSNTKYTDERKEELKEQDGLMAIRIKTVRGDGVRDLDEITAEFATDDFETFREEVEGFQDFMEHVADRARQFDPHRDGEGEERDR